MSTKSNPLSSTRFLTIPQRYAKLRARCPIPPEPWKKRQGRPRKVVSAVLSSVLHIEPWEYDPPELRLSPASAIGWRRALCGTGNLRDH